MVAFARFALLCVGNSNGVAKGVDITRKDWRDEVIVGLSGSVISWSQTQTQKKEDRGFIRMSQENELVTEASL